MANQQSISSNAALYHPRQPSSSPFYQLFRHHFVDFQAGYDERFSRSYGYYRQVISDVVLGYLRCGDLKQGFARIRCPDCRHEFLLSFSCRGRWFCPSCHAKKVVQFGEQLRENILYPLPHRQYVFSIPIILRKFFLFNRKLLSRLCKAASESLQLFLRQVLSLKKGKIGAVMTIQTFGDYGRWHPHIHAIVADGLFRENGVFHVMPQGSIRPLTELFRAKLLTMLKKEGLVNDEFITMIMKWRHTSGFSIHNGVRIRKDDERAMTALARYIIRSPFSVAKLSYNRNTGMVIYRSKMSHGKNRKNFKVATAEEFIADIVQHIPDRSFQLVRYYGWYSNRARGDRKKQQLAENPGQDEPQDQNVIDVSKYKPRKIPPPLWRECIKKIWEVDPLICPHCQSEMKIISFITAKDVIRRILVHLQLWGETEGRGPPERSSRHDELKKNDNGRTELQYQRFDDGWPGYEEPDTPG